MNILKREIKFLKESKHYIFVSIIIFLCFSVIGFIFPVFKEQILEMIQELQGIFQGLNLWETIGLIFFNNAKASLIAIMTGVFFGVFPLLIALTNGYIIGFVSNIVTYETSVFELWRLLPHGIFELPAVLISIGLGLKIGIEVLTKPTIKNLEYNLNESLRTFVQIIIPLLVIAAIIEGVLIFFS